MHSAKRVSTGLPLSKWACVLLRVGLSHPHCPCKSQRMVKTLWLNSQMIFNSVKRSETSQRLYRPHGSASPRPRTAPVHQTSVLPPASAFPTTGDFVKEMHCSHLHGCPSGARPARDPPEPAPSLLPATQKRLPLYVNILNEHGGRKEKKKGKDGLKGRIIHNVKLTPGWLLASSNINNVANECDGLGKSLSRGYQMNAQHAHGANILLNFPAEPTACKCTRAAFSRLE